MINISGKSSDFDTVNACEQLRVNKVAILLPNRKYTFVPSKGAFWSLILGTD